MMMHQQYYVMDKQCFKVYDMNNGKFENSQFINSVNKINLHKDSFIAATTTTATLVLKDNTPCLMDL